MCPFIICMFVKTLLRQSNLKFRPEKAGIISISLTLACSILKSLFSSSDLISLAVCHDEDGWCPVAFLGYGRRGTCHGRHFERRRKNCLAKIKIFIYNFLNLYFAPHAFIKCKAASTPRLYLKHYVGRVTLEPPSIMTKLW